jgi:hypothetical protein
MGKFCHTVLLPPVTSIIFLSANLIFVLYDVLHRKNERDKRKLSAAGGLLSDTITPNYLPVWLSANWATKGQH